MGAGGAAVGRLRRGALVGRGVLSVLRMNSAQRKSLRSEGPRPPQPTLVLHPGRQPRERCPGSALCSDPENEVPNSASGVTLTPQMPTWSWARRFSGHSAKPCCCLHCPGRPPPPLDRTFLFTQAQASSAPGPSLRAPTCSSSSRLWVPEAPRTTSPMGPGTLNDFSVCPSWDSAWSDFCSLGIQHRAGTLQKSRSYCKSEWERAKV